MQWLGALWQSPQWLWLLLALTVPLLIHLWRHSKTRQITFAAAHWLTEDLQQWRRFHLNNHWLLLLRLLIIALLALLLAEPLFKRETTAGPPLLLVDPRIEPVALNTFLTTELPEFSRAPERILWLQAKPVAIAETRPAAPELWRTLSVLADQPRFRHAHILLKDALNPTGHSALRISPHWQWHALDKSVEKPIAPRVAIIGRAPDWLSPLFQALGAKLPQLSLQPLSANIPPSAKTIDWLIYNRAETLPDSLLNFIHAGGLLISDRRLQAPPALKFIDLRSTVAADAAAIGRGSWLRYKGNWDNREFFNRADLPQKLWQQWAHQDWALQHNNRGSWSVNAPPAEVIGDDLVQTARYEGVQRLLLISLLLLLLLERMLALCSPLAGESSRNG